jgi:hypothetical protein
MMQIVDLPNEILLMIFKNLETEIVSKCSIVNLKFRDIAYTTLLKRGRLSIEGFRFWNPEERDHQCSFVNGRDLVEYKITDEMYTIMITIDQYKRSMSGKHITLRWNPQDPENYYISSYQISGKCYGIQRYIRKCPII